MSSTRPSPASPVADPAASVCPRCGAVFRCGMVAGDTHCWCADLPPLPLLQPGNSPAAASCFCPACLKFLTSPSS